MQIMDLWTMLYHPAKVPAMCFSLSLNQGCIFFLEKETIPERPSKIWKLFRKGIFTILFKPNSELHVVDFTHTVVLRTNGTSAIFSCKYP